MPSTFTTTTGCPVASPYASQQIGAPGPLLVQDSFLLDLLAHFDRERIPERVEHAQGHGAFGEFEVTGDVSELTSAAFLNKVGKKTPLLTRFSTASNEAGSAESVRDPRGFSVKLYTEEGNLDWVYNNSPVFYIRNPAKFPALAHAHRRNPASHLKDPTMFWDFMVQNPESLHQAMILFSDRGTPKASRFMNGYSGHTYKWVNSQGRFHYVKIHIISDQGIKNWSSSQSKQTAAESPDYATQDLFSTIAQQKFPSWTCYVQAITPQEAEKLPFSVFDVTKTWPKSQFPLREFGKIVLNRNPTNHFQDIEQAAFSPANVVPGWEASADPVLQLRLFSYPDAQRYRLGANYHQIPVNRCPFAHNPFARDGGMSIANYGPEPNYPSSFAPMQYAQAPQMIGAQRPFGGHEQWVSTASSFQWKDDGDYSQPTALWNIYKETKQDEALVRNIIAHAREADLRVYPHIASFFGRASPELARRLQQELMQLKL